MQIILAIVGIISLALMTTILTINLFWRLDDVNLKKEIIYKKDYLKIVFENKGKTICDMKATFVLCDIFTYEYLDEPKEYYMPVLLKNATWKLKLDLNETFWYKAVYNMLTSNHVKLYCIFSFIDAKTGQNSIKMEEISKENLRVTDNLLSYEEFIKGTVLSYKDLLTAENNKGTQKILKTANGIIMDYEFLSGADENSFVMTYYNFHEPNLNLEKYNKEKTYLELRLKTDDNITLNFEIKTKSEIYTEIIKLNDESKVVKIYLNKINYNLENINEICYTSLYKNNKPTGKLEVGDLRIMSE